MLLLLALVSLLPPTGDVIVLPQPSFVVYWGTNGFYIAKQDVGWTNSWKLPTNATSATVVMRNPRSGIESDFGSDVTIVPGPNNTLNWTIPSATNIVTFSGNVQTSTDLVHWNTDGVIYTVNITNPILPTLYYRFWGGVTNLVVK